MAWAIVPYASSRDREYPSGERRREQDIKHGMMVCIPTVPGEWSETAGLPRSKHVADTISFCYHVAALR